MIDRSIVGTEEPARTFDVERGRLRFFAKAIGETDPVYTDVEAARAAGHPDLPVPPTFLFGLELDERGPVRAGSPTSASTCGRAARRAGVRPTSAWRTPATSSPMSPRIVDVYEKRAARSSSSSARPTVTRGTEQPIAVLT